MFELINRLLHQADLSVAKTMDKSMSHGLLRYYRNIPNMRLEEIARECFVSPATLSRFCSKVDHVNYSKLSRAAREDVEYFDEITQGFADSIKDKPGITADGVAMATLENLTNALSSLRDTVDYDQVVTVARRIYNSDLSMILMHKAHRAVVTDFQLNMTLLGKPVFCTSTDNPDISSVHKNRNYVLLIPTYIDHFIGDAMTDGIKSLIDSLNESCSLRVVYFSMHPEKLDLKENECCFPLPHPTEPLPFPALVGKQLLQSVLDMVYYSYYFIHSVEEAGKNSEE
ncbi:MAG: hypothetical protein E7328_01075 [Clostridiales bacterium]|nr:hypothetical protein [Clostridiales bacterium]